MTYAARFSCHFRSVQLGDVIHDITFNKLKLYTRMAHSSKVYCNVIILFFISGAAAEIFTILSASAIGLGSYLSYCKFFECCNDDYIYFDSAALEGNLTSELYGQPLAKNVLHALKGHINNMKRNKDQKSLTLSFNGYPGNGKNFLANMITNSLYKYGQKSKFVKLYIGRHHFPDPTRVEVYKSKILSEINGLLKSCPRSLIIFDEVNDIPEGVIDVIKAMIDFHGTVDGIDYSKAIFILISNTGGKDIMEHFVQLGKPREDIELADFENVIRKALHFKGGLKESGILYSNLIDHYIPFLPLEENHVRKCLKREFEIQGVFNPSEKMMDTVMSSITYGPTSNPIFANAGCKRIRNLVSFVAARGY